MEKVKTFIWSKIPNWTQKRFIRKEEPKKCRKVLRCFLLVSWAQPSSGVVEELTGDGKWGPGVPGCTVLRNDRGRKGRACGFPPLSRVRERDVKRVNTNPDTVPQGEGREGWTQTQTLSLSDQCSSDRLSSLPVELLPGPFQWEWAPLVLWLNMVAQPGHCLQCGVWQGPLVLRALGWTMLSSALKTEWQGMWWLRNSPRELWAMVWGPANPLSSGVCNFRQLPRTVERQESSLLGLATRCACSPSVALNTVSQSQMGLAHFPQVFSLCFPTSSKTPKTKQNKKPAKEHPNCGQAFCQCMMGPSKHLHGTVSASCLPTDIRCPFSEWEMNLSNFYL